MEWDGFHVINGMGVAGGEVTMCLSCNKWNGRGWWRGNGMEWDGFHVLNKMGVAGGEVMGWNEMDFML